MTILVAHAAAGAVVAAAVSSIEVSSTFWPRPHAPHLDVVRELHLLAVIELVVHLKPVKLANQCPSVFQAVDHA